MHRTSLFALALLASTLVVACSGKAVVEPAEITGKRAKLFLDRCEPEPPPEGTGELEEVYLCLPAEDVCGEASDPKIQEALGFQVEKVNACGKTVELHDVPCGPDLNAVQCCYAARIRELDPCQ